MYVAVIRIYEEQSDGSMENVEQDILLNESKTHLEIEVLQYVRALKSEYGATYRIYEW